MIIGFTGTRHGMSNRQQVELEDVLRSIVQEYICQSEDFNLEAIDGGCIGADYEFHRTARDFGFKSICYPGISSKNPSDMSCRADLSGYDEIKPEKPFFQRNRFIATDCQLLIAAPFTNNDTGGGTWYTINYAKKIGRDVIILKR